MSYDIHSDSEVAYVETFGPVDIQERVSIVNELQTLIQVEPKLSVIIDHHHAQIEAGPEEAYEFGRQIIQFSRKLAKLDIYVIASGENRRIVDISAMVAANANVSLKVCENREEAFRKLNRHKTRTSRITEV